MAMSILCLLEEFPLGAHHGKVLIFGHLGPGPYAPGPIWAQAQMGPGPNGPGPKWAWAHMSPGPNGPRPKWARAQMGPDPNGPGPTWARAQIGPGPELGPTYETFPWCLSLAGFAKGTK